MTAYTRARADVALDLLKSKGETAEHFALKLHAARKLKMMGYRIVCFEVSAYAAAEIADVVGIDLAAKRAAVVEAKATRPDFLKDATPAQAAIDKYEQAVDRYHAGERNTHPARPSRKFRHSSALKGLAEAWIITPAGLITADELPEGWGWMTPEKIRQRPIQRDTDPRRFRQIATQVFYRLANVYGYDLIGYDRHIHGTRYVRKPRLWPALLRRMEEEDG